jgi:hypothetical protein
MNSTKYLPHRTTQPLELLPFDAARRIPKVILSVGGNWSERHFSTSLGLCQSFKKTGARVAYVRLVGKACPFFCAKTCENGADFAADFTDCGYTSTHTLSHTTLLDLFQTLVDRAEKAVRPDYIIMDIGADVQQKETNSLLTDMLFLDTVHNVIYSCGDGQGILDDWEILNDCGCPPFAVVRLGKMNKRDWQKAARFIDVPILTADDITEGCAVEILRGAKGAPTRPALLLGV